MEADAVSVCDYCAGDELIELSSTVHNLLSPLRRPYRSTSLSPEYLHWDTPRCESESGSESSTSTSAPTTPIEVHATLQSLLYRGVESREKMPDNIVYIDLLRPGSSINANDQLWTSPLQVAEERSLVERGYKIVRSSKYPRHLREIDPTITFLSHSLSNARSYFTVHLGDRLMFSESTTLELIDPDHPSTSNIDGVLYKTSLVPGFWDTISKSSGMSIEFSCRIYYLNIMDTDASQYTIIQQVIQDPCSSSSSPSTIFSAVYKFLYQTSTPTAENFSIAHTFTEPLVQNDEPELCLDNLLSMEDDAFPDMMDFIKIPDFFETMDFVMPDWSEQSSPVHSVFSSPVQYPQVPVVNGVPDEDMLPASIFEIDSPNYVSNNHYMLL